MTEFFFQVKRSLDDGIHAIGLCVLRNHTAVLTTWPELQSRNARVDRMTAFVLLFFPEGSF